MHPQRKPSLRSISRETIDSVYRAVLSGGKTLAGVARLSGKPKETCARALAKLMAEGKVLGVRGDRELNYLPAKVLFQGGSQERRG